MKKIVLFDTSCGSLNMGDYIICESVEREMADILNDGFLIKVASHTPVTHFYQNFNRNSLYSFCKQADYKFLAGTDILQYHMAFRPWANLNTNIINCAPYKDVILVAAGTNKNRPKLDLYSKLLYKKILNKSFIHSARDESTKVFIESLGLKAINTGCATMWSLTKEHCKQIPRTKSESVIFTITDYKKDPENDKALIEILKRNYKKVYFWVQGASDLEYLNSISDDKDIAIVSPNLNSYREVLCSGKIDYVGTRLHAGIFALQNKVRSIILSVDNRASDIADTYGLVVVPRSNHKKLEEMINSSFETKVKIDEEKIVAWKAQFK